MVGAAGADWLFGRTGSDVMYGGRSDDAITGGPGTDYLVGGPGADKINAKDEEVDFIVSNANDGVEKDEIDIEL